MSFAGVPSVPGVWWGLECAADARTPCSLLITLSSLRSQLISNSLEMVYINVDNMVNIPFFSHYPQRSYPACHVESLLKRCTYVCS